MPKWLKIVLAVFVAGVVGLGACVGGVAWWANGHKDKLLADGKAAMAEGEAFGRSHAKGACVDDGLSRLKACTPLDLVCETTVRLRVASCAKVAADDGFCASVPDPTAILKSAMWANDECTRRDAEDVAACGRVLQSVAQECAEAKR